MTIKRRKVSNVIIIRHKVSKHSNEKTGNTGRKGWKTQHVGRIRAIVKNKETSNKRI